MTSHSPSLATAAQTTPTGGWRLERQSTDSDGPRQVAIESLPFRIGRTADNTLCLPMNSVSSHHAELTLEAGELSVRDLGSTNGTYVNGKRIEAATPLESGAILQIANVWMRVVNKQTLPPPSSGTIARTMVEDSQTGALALSRFSDLLEQRAVEFEFEPVADLRTGETVAWEARASSRIFGLTKQQDMEGAARQLNRELELCQLLRAESVQASYGLEGSPWLFADVDPTEIADPQRLLQSLQELRDAHPTSRIHLNAPANACFDTDSLHEMRAGIDALCMDFSLDDFGDGNSRLIELTELNPYCVRFESRFSANLKTISSERRRLTQALVEMVSALGVKPAAKGVATQEDAEMCLELGFELGQGPWLNAAKS